MKNEEKNFSVKQRTRKIKTGFYASVCLKREWFKDKKMFFFFLKERKRIKYLKKSWCTINVREK